MTAGHSRALALVLLAVAGRLPAQPATAPPPIKDNSFLVEEAYNQEKGVVQHISNLVLGQGGGWAFSFTQEWPMGTQAHQFSFTLLAARVGEGGGSQTGLGDLALNYRFQAKGGGDERLAFSPRLSVLIPTGDSRRGLGQGSAGFQANLPLSVTLSKKLVTHWNAGATYTPSARNAAGDEARYGAINLAQSAVWLASQRFNLLLETVWIHSWEVAAADRTEPVNRFLVSPGVRWAHDFKSGLQIVPGAAFTFGLGPSAGERAVFLYLSFEHPFGRKRAE